MSQKFEAAYRAYDRNRIDGYDKRQDLNVIAEAEHKYIYYENTCIAKRRIKISRAKTKNKRNYGIYDDTGKKNTQNNKELCGFSLTCRIFRKYCSDPANKRFHINKL